MEITKIDFWYTIIACIVVWLLCSSCVTNGRLDEDGRNAIRTITQLEEQLSSVDRRLEEITDRAQNLEGDIGIFEQQFRVYVDCFREMRATIVRYKTETERATDEDEKAKLDSGDISGLFRRCEDNDDSSTS